MDYQQALAYIHATPNFARAAGLERIRALMERLGNPQMEFPCVHIAGTNGKGSTAAMTASILEAAGLRTGLYTSPYLERFNERMRINGVDIPDQELADLTQEIKEAVEALEAEGVESPNEFERVTAIGLLWFARQKVDVAVLEVGLGGRYDATNVIPAPLCTAVTSISLDHTHVLGDTVEKIAMEKGGIFKKGSPAVISPGQQWTVEAVLSRLAAEVGAPLTVAGREEITVLSRDASGLRFRWQDRKLFLPLLGEYQVDNVCTVLHIIEILSGQGIKISPEAVEQGLANVTWPGRLELLEGDFLLDAGHNPGGIAALCQELETTFSGRRVYTVMGMLADKDYRECLAAVARRSAAFFAVSPPSPRALGAKEIAACARTDCKQVTAWDSAEEAVEAAIAARRPGSLVLVCGSIPLVGQVRQYLRVRR